MKKTKIKVLLIEDNPADVLLLKESLSMDPLTDFQVTVAELLKQGTGKLAEENFDVLLLDLGLPDSQGLETFEGAHKKITNTPIIVLSGMTDDLTALQAVHSGAQDYLVKGETGWNLAPRAIRYAIERHHSQMAMRASESRFSTFFRSSPMPTTIIRLSDNNILEVNEAWSQITGYPQNEVIGRSIDTLDLWVDLEKQKEFIELLKKNGTLRGFEAQMKQRSGSTADVLFSVELIEIAGEPCLLSMTQDITERKRNENFIQEQERFIRATFDSLPEQICVLDENYKIISTNLGWKRFAAQNDHLQDDFTGVNYLSICRSSSKQKSDEADKFADGLVAVMNGEIAEYSMEYPCDSLTEKRWFMAKVIPFPGEGLRRIVVSHTNITQLKTSEEALRLSEGRHRLISGLISDYVYSGVAFSNGSSRTEWVSGAFEKITGYTFDEMNSHPNGFGAFLLPEDFEEVVNHQKVFLDKGSLSIEYRIRRKDGEIRWLLDQMTTATGEAADAGTRILGAVRDITERRLTGEALQASEMRFRALIEHGLDNISLLDPNGTLLWENPAAIHMLGYRHDQFREQNIFELVHPDDISVVQKQFAEILNKAGNVIHGTFRLKHADGSWRWVEGIGTNLLHEPSVSAVVINYRDITERKQADDALSESKRLLQTVIDTTPIRIFWKDTKSRYLGCNPTFAVDAGLTHPREIIGKSDFELAWKSQAEIYLSDDQQVMNSGIPKIAYDEPQVTPDGKNIWLRISKAPLRNNKKQIIGILGVYEDITERKQSELALQESQRHYRALFEDSPIAIWEEDFSQVKKRIDELKQKGVTDFKAYFIAHPDEVAQCTKMIEVLDVNSAALKMYQAPSKEALIENTIRTLCIGEMEHNREDFIAIAEGKTSNTWDGNDETMAGGSIEISLTWSVVPGYENDFSRVIVTTVDITDRKQAEALIYQYANELELHVEERTAELVHASRAKDEFLANMSHELRTPLNGILGFSETLLEGIRGPLNEKQVQAVEIIQSSGQHLLGLINDILDVSKIESGKFELQPETLVINDICHSSLNFVKQLAQKKSIKVEYFSRPASSTLVADPKRLKQILVNLLNNAVKFTPAKGNVKLEVYADASAGLMRFSVTDTGIGIAPEDQQKLFMPFIQVDSSLSRQYEGTGLGLSLVKKLVEMHGGAIELTSEVGSGSCFAFALPWNPTIKDPEPQTLFKPKSNENKAATDSISLHSKKILVVDDNEANITMVRDYLENCGYQVHIAYNGSDAVREADKFLPNVILMDIQMPHMNGIEATRRLRSDLRFATLPIIALTALAMPGDRERCLEAGMDDYLSKPIKLKELSQMIERFMEQASSE